MQRSRKYAPVRSDQEEMWLREDLLEGRSYGWVKEELIRRRGLERARQVGQPDTARNALQRVIARLAVLHNPLPMVLGLDATLAGLIGDFSGLLMQRRYEAAAVQELGVEGARPMPSTMGRVSADASRYWLAANDAGIYVHWTGRKLNLTRVRPSELQGMADPERPGHAILLGRLKERQIEGKWIECWDIWDLRGEDPVFMVAKDVQWSPDGDFAKATDVTKLAIPGAAGPLAGEDYWWRFGAERDGEPFIPVQLYHLQHRSELFDRQSGSELAQGALTNGVNWTYAGHCLQDASNPQRNTANLTPEMAVPNSGSDAQVIPTGPAVVVQWKVTDPSKPFSHWQDDPGADPELVGRAALAYEQSLEGLLLPLDVSSTGGDPIQQLEAARAKFISQLYPICREGDGQLLEICAAIANRQAEFLKSQGQTPSFGGHAESGYSLLYREEIPTLTEEPPEKAGAEDDERQDGE